jgi:hypothetical protein
MYIRFLCLDPNDNYLDIQIGLRGVYTCDYTVHNGALTGKHNSEKAHLHTVMRFYSDLFFFQIAITSGNVDYILACVNTS